MRILFVIPPLYERTYPGKTMGPDYLAKALLDEGYNVNILDLDVLGINELEENLRKYNPDIVGITNLSIQNDVANKIAQNVKKFNRNIIVIKGGFHELFGYEFTLQYHHNYVDYVVVGEGEKTIVEIAKAFETGNLQDQRKSISGLAFIEDDRVIYTGKSKRLNIGELDDAIPERIFYDNSYNFDVFDGRKTAQVLTVRGCINACNFCLESQVGHKERQRHLSSVYNELFELKEDGYEAIYFDDSTFTRDENRVKEICKMFRNNFPDMIWGCNTRDDCLNEELINIMQNSGCVYLFTGFESAVSGILIGMNKTHHTKRYLNKAIKIYKLMKNSKINSSVFLIFGSIKKMNIKSGLISNYSPESFEDVKYTLNFVFKELKPHFLSMNVLRLLPGTPFSNYDKYKSIRPQNQIIHTGFYDKMWYKDNNVDDIRTKHHIYRAFEGRGSIVPPNMTPEYCYKILTYAIDIVNEYNTKNGYRCEIVMDKDFETQYIKKENGKYTIKPFNEISCDK